MKKRYLRLMPFLFAVSDVFLINMCLFICFYLSGKYLDFTNNIGFVDILSCTMIWLLSAHLFSLYSVYTIVKPKSMYRATRRSILVFIVIFQVYAIWSNNDDYSNGFLLCFYLATILCFLLGRIAYGTFDEILSRNFDNNKAVSIFAIASIGGHWVQLLRLMPLFKLNDMTFASTKASLEEMVKGYKYYTVPDANRNNKLDLIKCCLSITWVIISSRPKVIITTGAAPGLFGIFIGRLLGIKTIWIDSMANVEKLSLSGNIALKIADRVYTQWQHLSTPKIVFAGNILEG